MVKKIIWLLFSLKNKLFFGKFGFPSYIARPIYIRNQRNIYIGDKVRVYPLSRIECNNKKSKLVICDDVSIGPFINITCSNNIIINEGVTISSNVFITDMDHTYTKIDMPIMQQNNKLSKTVIGQNSFIGTGVVLLAGTRLGKQCIVGANSVVRGDFPDYVVISGNPAKIIKYYCNKEKKWKKNID